MKPALITYTLADNIDHHVVNQSIDSVIKYLQNLQAKGPEARITIGKTPEGHLSLTAVKQASEAEARDIAKHRLALLDQQRNQMESSLAQHKKTMEGMVVEIERLHAESNAMRKFVSEG
jgi:hypothetical protein